jgi:hypothetical protein
MTSFRVLWFKITRTAEYYRLLWEDTEQRSDAYICVRALSLGSKRDVHRLTAGPFPLFILRQQRLKESGWILLHEGISECGFFFV